MPLDFRTVASTGFSTLGAYAATGGPGSLAIASFATGPVGAAVGIGITGLTLALSLVGRGRKEADIIVPLQNQYAGILDAVNATLVQDPGLTREQLDGLQHMIAAGYAEFDAFTRDGRFTDGRASVQARNTIRPYVDGRNDNGNLVDQTGGVLGKIQLRMEILVNGGLPPGSAAAAAAAGGSGGMPVLVGGGILLAKLLGLF